MATMTSAAFDVGRLDDLEAGHEHEGRIPYNLRRHFGILGFGIRAFRAAGEGHVIGEHDEAGPGASGQEELYFVVSGSATFTVNGETVPASAGTFVFVRDPAAKRSAVAEEEGTTVLVIGGTPGKAYEVHPGDLIDGMWKPYRDGDYEAALAVVLPVLEERPEAALVLFNAACLEALLGRPDEAIGHLERAVEADGRFRENLRTDSDLDSLRDDPRFVGLAA